MPPKKKARLSRAASTPQADDSSELLQVGEINVSSMKEDAASRKTVPDLWTDEEEICLFKGMIRWKPVGLHKHFRMISLSQHLSNHGHRENHTNIPGIWAKLGELYNLKTLDEREDAFGEPNSDDSTPPEDRFHPFTLPDDFDEMIEERRVDPAGQFSPPMLAHQLSNRSEAGGQRASTIDDTEDLRSSPASMRGVKSIRGGRGSKATRRSRLQQESKESTPKGKRNSKAAKEPSVEADEDEESEEDDEDEEDDDDEDGTPSSKRKPTKPHAGRGRGGRSSLRGRGPGRRARGRN